MNEILTVKEAATFLRKHPGTIRRWIEEKQLRARKLSAGKNGIWAILRNDLLELAVTDSIERKARMKKTQKHADNNKTSQVQLPL